MAGAPSRSARVAFRLAFSRFAFSRRGILSLLLFQNECQASLRSPPTTRSILIKNQLERVRLRSYQTRTGLEVVMAYLDEALKLDARALMAMAMKQGRKNRYSIRLSCGAGEV